MPQVSVFLALSLFFFNLIGSSNGAPENNSFDRTCPSHQCGNVSVSYPFWRVERSASGQHCGYPAFGVVCEGEEATLRISREEQFPVTDINYSERTVSLVDFAAGRETSCPRALRNLTFEAQPLFYSRLDVNLSFYCDCRDVPETVPHIECLESDGNRTYVFLEGTEPNIVDWRDYCEEKVIAAVMRRNLRDDPNVSSWFGEAMRDGFVLNWGNMTGGCEACVESRGRCGFDGMRPAEVLCFCPDGTRKRHHCRGRQNHAVKLGIGISAGVAAILVIVIFSTQRKRISGLISLKIETVNGQDVETFLRNYGANAPKRYNYTDIKRMTNSFRDKLGQGGYGAVYKGKLSDGHLVAVKTLSDSEGNGEDFINEVASISRTSHVNVVTLLGFCYQGSKRALVYEFMSNGSLDKFICHDGPLATNCLNLKAMCQIAVGVARGLEYLHSGCNTRIVHFDIKPHNILLDDDFCPKISDFGLAKLCRRKESALSMLTARGTIGYIAPEVFCRNFGRVSHKSDVYSYGMMLLEMVGGRKENGGGEVNNSSEMYFPDCVYKLLETDEDLTCKHGNASEEEKGIAKKMTLVGLWCIQTNPADRPSIGNVVEMLEGGIESLQIPPRPFLSSPTRFTHESSSSS